MDNNNKRPMDGVLVVVGWVTLVTPLHSSLEWGSQSHELWPYVLKMYGQKFGQNMFQIHFSITLIVKLNKEMWVLWFQMGHKHIHIFNNNATQTLKLHEASFSLYFALHVPMGTISKHSKILGISYIPLIKMEKFWCPKKLVAQHSS